MADRPNEPANPEASTSPGSVFGNLPDSRPGGRSPRRDSAAKPRRPSATKASPKQSAKLAATKAKPKTGSKPSPSRPASRPQRAAPPPEPAVAEPESGGGLEDIAWAGVAAAAEAATLGVRLANRALEALRGTSEKS